MKIEHIALYVQDLEGAKDFFVKYFDASPNDKYHNPKTGFSSYFLTFDDGARLEIMYLSEIQESENTHARMGYIHIAFSVGSREKVDALTNRFREDGYRILSGPRTTGDGYYESCILGFEGNQIEITE
ncbi:MAG: glyoxalase [Clostridiaceae bacterium]|nr:glyoxalase [Clostridiaceae bacterium]